MIVTPRPENSQHASDDSKPANEAFVTAANNVLHKYLMNATSSLSPHELANLKDTPNRAARGWAQAKEVPSYNLPKEAQLLNFVMSHTSMLMDIERTLSTGFPGLPDTTPTLITQGPIKVKMLCPHHLMYVRAEVFVSYLPRRGGMLLGLSKLARLALLLGRRPVLQEQYTQELALSLHHPEASTKWPCIESDGAAVQVVASHECMSCRGVMSNALTHTAALTGEYAHNSQVRQEFYSAVAAIRHSKF